MARVHAVSIERRMLIVCLEGRGWREEGCFGVRRRAKRWSLHLRLRLLRNRLATRNLEVDEKRVDCKLEGSVGATADYTNDNVALYYMIDEPC